MQIEPQSGIPGIDASASQRALFAFASVAFVMASVFAIFWQTFASMAATWARSDTYAHGFLVVPAVLWMVWRLRTRLAATEARPWWPGCLAMMVAGLLWLVGELSSTLALSQVAIVALVPAAVLSLFGWAWLRVLAFPLAFLLFAVPFGEFLVPTLIEWTADFTVTALAATGIPVFREGAHFVIPSGRWSVVAACSGIRYLIASVFVGSLFAWMMYRSAARRALFIGASFLVPVVANWVRAYLIVLVGHLSDNRIAADVDHLIYGWLFFGLVVALLFWIGSHWREDLAEESHGRGPDELATAEASVLETRIVPSWPIVAAVVVLAGAWPGVRDLVLAGGDKRPVVMETIELRSGWTPSSVAAADWRPALEGPAATQTSSFTANGVVVTAHVGIYRDQRQGRELVNSLNRLAPEEGRTDWTQIEAGALQASFGPQRTSTVQAATLWGRSGKVRVWRWYWVDGEVTTSDARAKLVLARDRLLGRSDTSAWVTVFTAYESDAVADRNLAEFLRDMGPSLQTALTVTSNR